MLPSTLKMLVFFDSSYPYLCDQGALSELMPGEVEFIDAAHLASALEKPEPGEGEGTTLVSFHGPYFPKTAWRALLRFLENGGNLAIFGGMPFARPVDEDGKPEPEQDAYTRQIFLGPFFQITPPASAPAFVTTPEAAFLRDDPWRLTEEDPGTFWSFYPRMTQVDDHPEELGSSGPFDTVLLPLIHARVTTPTGAYPIATPALVLDQLSGRFSGGRWLISAWQPASARSWLDNARTIQQLLLFAAEGATRAFELRPALACYQPGETPALIASARSNTSVQARVTVYQPGEGGILQSADLTFSPATARQEQRLRLPPLHKPGLYLIEAEYRYAEGQPLTTRSGFWIWDEALVEMTRSQRLEADRDYFTRDGQPFFVYGTTYMDSRVQRKFLHLPNPGRWDQDMAEMRACGINLIRTGLWTAWRELVPVAGSANEAFLRALDAFVLTACKHNIQVIFTFFAFFPLLFEGENPWLDPRSLAAQSDFVALLARRYAGVGLVSWDLINEPSFGDPKRIFSPRPLPSYDRFEVAAFQQWLQTRYTLSELQLRWRQTPADLPDWEHILPPVEADYDTHPRNTTTRLSLKVADFTLFSQEMFQRWAARMVEAMRSAGCQTLIGVGQDEAGTRIAPQFYAAAVDYTTTHPWWNIDDLLWDMLLDKTPARPNLIQETGVMLARDIDARPWRNEWENARLLERKLFTGLLARGAGLIQWLWHTNAYMTSDNENSIGLLRPDGSAKPELASMLEFGRLVSALEGRLLIQSATPDVWLVVPYAQWFTRPEAARHGTQRATRVLGYNLGVIPQLIGEYQLASLTAADKQPRAVIVPALQLLTRQAWGHLLRYIHAGGTLLVNGVLARDQHNLPFDLEIDDLDHDLPSTPISLYENLTLDNGETYQLSFQHEATNYVKKAHNQVRTYRHGAGQLIWCGLPLELAGETPTLNALYRQVLRHSPVEDENLLSCPVLLVQRPIKGGKLTLVVSEISNPQTLLLEEDGVQLTIEPNRAGALIQEHNGSTQTFGGLLLS
ncbi:MAG TPA: beta-galactosidase [Ktedonobacteraceae bacterium]|nr:beta-galactosidase [Ktedonobacteraceae bacterium]